MKMLLAILAVAAFLLGMVDSSFAQSNLITLANFNGSNGNEPRCSMTLSSDGRTLYGTTNEGGAYGDGTVFSIPVGGGAVTTLATFNDSNGEGPYVGLLLVGSTLYGTTNEGGTIGNGTVYSIPIGGGEITTLANFNYTNGGNPNGLTLSSDGKTLYGTTYTGGAYSEGTVFSVPIGGGAITTLASFNGTNGELPRGIVTLSNDGKTLYGTTSLGGSGFVDGVNNGQGTVFSVPVGGGAITTLASFNGTNGVLINDGLLLVGTTLYGTTEQGGIGYVSGLSGYGTVFSIPVSGGAVTTLANFNGSNGANPMTGLTLSSNGRTLYGTTENGGTIDNGINDGTVYSIPIGGGEITTLVNFNGSNGANPLARLTLSSDGKALYGTTESGGSEFVPSGNDGYGTVFSVPLYNWQTADVTVGSDNNTRLLWNKSDGTAGVWTVDNNGATSNLTNIGPFAGWTASSIAAGADGLTRMLWNKTDGTAGLWLLNANNTYKTGFNFGPYTGWKAINVAVGADNKTRLLWIKSDGTAGVWTVDNSGNLTNLTNYGPFPGWTASRIAAGADGLTRMLWNKTDGTAGLWLLNANNTQKSGFNFGPFYGTTAVDVTVGADNKARLLWTDLEGQVAVWTVDNSGNYTNATSFGPNTGWIATKIAVGGDGLSRLLWSEGSGTQAFWLLNSNNSYNNGFNFGPY